MAVVNGYCTVADFRSELTDADAALDESLIENAINAASRAIDNYCGRRFWQDASPVVRQYEVEDLARPAPVDDISTSDGLVVQLDSNGDGTYAATLAAADYQLRPLNADADGGAYAWRQIALVGGRRFPRARNGFANLQVTAQWGWSQVPADVAKAARLKAVALFKRKDAPFGVAGFGEFGAVRITRQDTDVQALLAPFMLPGIA